MYTKYEKSLLKKIPNFMEYIIYLNKVKLEDTFLVGNKNASLGELIAHLNDTIIVPEGFATTKKAFDDFLAENKIKNKIIILLESIDQDNNNLKKISSSIEKLILQGTFNTNFEYELITAYNTILNLDNNVSFAVRSSSTHEDLENASFAGQQNTYLNILGIQNIILAIKKVYASLYSETVLSYKLEKNISIHDCAMCTCIQKMIAASSSGVIFTIDPESEFKDIISISSSYGLGEAIVQGMVSPDEFIVYKPNLAIIQKNYGIKNIKTIYNNDYSPEKSIKTISLTDKEKNFFSLSEEEIITLAKQAIIIEEHYKRPMDIEWAKDSLSNKIYILQARPITTLKKGKTSNNKKYSIQSEKNKFLLSGRAVGKKAFHGTVRIIKNYQEGLSLTKKDILVTNMTDPNWEPIMKRVGGIITNLGGRTCHAAIIARELGIPAIVGCQNATNLLLENQQITLSCCEGDTGIIYQGTLKIQINEMKENTQNNKKTPVKLMLNICNPALAFELQDLPNDGVGLARIEFISSSLIKIHPQAILNYATLPENIKTEINEKISGYLNPKEFYIEKLAEGIATIAAAFNPKEVIVRFSDFKSNEYKTLLGGELYEIDEENPMLGFRGAGRYISDTFKDCFALECKAIEYVRNKLNLQNVSVMIPFVRTLNEAEKVIEALACNNLKRGKDNLKIYMMCEIPANALLADEFLLNFDGFSIGSNDMTQLVLGIDRDGSKLISESFDERNLAVKKTISLAIAACKKQNKYIGICGQGPSDHLDFASWLIGEGIESISLNPDTILEFQEYIQK